MTTEFARVPTRKPFTGRALWDLAVFMVSLGLIMGLVFPPFVIALGVPAGIALSPPFMAATVGAGLIVGMVNFGLARRVIGHRLRLLTDRMGLVERTLTQAAFTGDWSACDPQTCSLQVDSEDEFGAITASFNQLLEALSRSHRVEEITREFAVAMSSFLDVEGLSSVALRLLVNAVGAQAGAMAVVRNGHVCIAAARGLQATKSILESPVLAAALRDGAVARMQIADGLEMNGALVAFRSDSAIVIPAIHNGVAVGAAVLAGDRKFDVGAERLLALLLPAFGVALNNAISHERFRHLAAFDPLTGIWNRRLGMTRLGEEYARSIRSAQPLGVLMLDIDHFKAINDAHGHLVGDHVLKRVAHAARLALREGDMLARYGGDEFLAVLPAARLANLGVMGDRIRRAISELPFEYSTGTFKVTVSVGGSSWPESEVVDYEALLAHADACLYVAKEGGRDRVEMPLAAHPAVGAR